MPTLNVKSGSMQVLLLSGPKVLEFQASLIDGKLRITPDMRHDSKIKGQAGETYSCAINTENPAEVYLHVDGKSTSLGKVEYG